MASLLPSLGWSLVGWLHLLAADGGTHLNLAAPDPEPPAAASQPSLLAPVGPNTAAAVTGVPLLRTPDGGFQYEGGRFSAHIGPDGRVTWRKPSLLSRFLHSPGNPYDTLGWVLSVVVPGGGFGASAEERPVPVPPHGVMTAEPNPFVADPREVARVNLDPWWVAPGVLVTLPLVPDRSVDFDALFSSKDPDREAKADFLAATLDLRMHLAARQRQQDLREAFDRLPGWLDQFWADPTYSALEKRRVLFLLWDEADTSIPAGRAVAAQITGFVRRKLPRGSADAYDESELAAFNRGARAGHRFDPYAAAPK